MSPILVRPVREQLEHDRVIRLLQAKYKRKFDVAVNPGNQQTAPVGPVNAPWYPDLVLHAGQRTRKLAGIVEVETAESINHLEAMSQWATFAKMRVPFHLYVPAAGVDSAKRLSANFSIAIGELWTYQVIGDQIRFALAQRSAQPGVRAASGGTASKASRPKAQPRVVKAKKASGASKAAGAKTRTTKKTAARRAGASSAARRPASSRLVKHK